MSPDLKTLRSDGRQVSTVEVVVVDHDGNRRRVPDAADNVMLEVTGAGRLVALNNADLADSSPVEPGRKKVYRGRAVAVVRSGAQAGKITVRATAARLTAGETILSVEP